MILVNKVSFLSNYFVYLDKLSFYYLCTIFIYM